MNKYIILYILVLLSLNTGLISTWYVDSSPLFESIQHSLKSRVSPNQMILDINENKQRLQN